MTTYTFSGLSKSGRYVRRVNIRAYNAMQANELAAFYFREFYQV